MPMPRLLRLLPCAMLATAAAAQTPEAVWQFAPPAGFVDVSPAVADLDGDGAPEVVCVTTGGHAAALDAAGRTRWTRRIPGPLAIPPTVADLEGDGAPEVIVLGPGGTMYALDGATGEPAWEAPALGTVKWGATAVAAGDLDGDGALECVAGDLAGALACVDAAGRIRWRIEAGLGTINAPALADLDGDGALEVLAAGTAVPLACYDAQGGLRWKIGRPGPGGAPVVAALDGTPAPTVIASAGEDLIAVDAEGKTRWSYRMKMPIDAGIAIGDLRGDPQPEIVAVDMSGRVVCLDAAGALLWDENVEQRARRAPAIADLDGDGAPEVAIASYAGALFVYASDGLRKARVPLGQGSNATPAVVDAPDGARLLVCSVASAPMAAFRWPGAPAALAPAWGQYRGSAARDAGPPRSAVGPRIAAMDAGALYAGTNRMTAEAINPDGETLTLVLRAAIDGGAPLEARVSSSDPAFRAELPYGIAGAMPAAVRLEATLERDGKPLQRRMHEAYLVPFQKELHDLDARFARIRALLEKAPSREGIEERAAFLEARLPALRAQAAAAGSLPDAERRALRSALAETLARSAVIEAMLAQAAAAGSVLVAAAANPWATFAGMGELPEGRAATPDLEIEAFAGEHESAALNVFNLGGRTLTLRVEPVPLEGPDGPRPWREALSLHEAIETPTDLHEHSADALPRLNQAYTLIVPAWEARQLFLDIGTKALGPGEWRGALRLRSLDAEPIEAAAPLRIRVWDTPQPPMDSLRLCHWGYVHTSVLKETPEAALEDQIAHGTSVFVGLFFPKATFDETGALGPIDFADHDAYVKQHHPHGSILFCGYQGALQGPAAPGSETYRTAHVAWLRAWAAHLEAMGIGFDGWALYPVDEPGLTQGLVDQYLLYAKLAREADPRIRMYTDPVGRITEDELRSMTPYVDIWCPNRNGFLLKEGADKLAIIRAAGKPVWTYECEGNVKHQSPLGYYRAQAWLAWQHKLEGIGFWTYCTSQYDPWFRPGTDHDYLMVYQGDGVVSSKRWEAVRDGLEDHALLAELQRRIDAGAGSAPIRAEAAAFLDAHTAAIAQFCGLDAHDTVPGDGGLPAQRQVEDARWAAFKEARRSLAGLLERLR